MPLRDADERQKMIRCWVALAFVAVWTHGCSRDPNSITITEAHKDNVLALVGEESRISGDDRALLKAAESRARRSHTTATFVGKTVGTVIAGQRQWQAERERLRMVLEPVYRAAKTIEASVGVGVNLPKHQELIQALAAELNIAADKVTTDDERRVASLFAAVLEAYQHAGLLWTKSVESARYEWYRDGEIAYSIGKSPPNPELARLVEFYKIPVRDGKIQYIGTAFQALPKASIQIVWRVADSRLNEAVQAYSEK